MRRDGNLAAGKRAGRALIGRRAMHKARIELATPEVAPR